MMKIELTHLTLRYASLRVMDRGRVSRLAASIANDGQKAPVLLVDGLVLVDGYHRVEALRSLGRDIVLAIDLGVSEAEALVLAWRLETGRRKTALEEGWMLVELVEGQGRSLAEIGTEMRRARSWVSERIGMVRVLPESVQQAVREARIPANGAMKSLVPMARTDRAACERMVGGLEKGVTVRQLERLYATWRKADPEGRERIVSHPMLLLKAEEAVSEVPIDEEERLSRDFEAIAGLSRRARRQVTQGAFPRGNGPARRTWVQAEEAFQLLREEVIRARP